MRTQTDVVNELKDRISADIQHYGGTLPERVAIAWRGYLAALIEWGLIDVPGHDQLVQMLPDIPNDPVVDILLGREQRTPAKSATDTP